MKIQKFWFIGFMIIFSPLLIQANHAFAHKVIIFAWVEKDMIYTQSSFGSKRKAKNCTITVENEKGVVVHEGKTDQEGNYSFKIPKKIDSDLILNLSAGSGHKAKWKISMDELAANPSEQDILNAMKKKDELEKKPSILKIITGIAIIFCLALGIKFLKRKPS